MPLAYYFYLRRQEQNDHFRLGALFITYPISQISFAYYFSFTWLFTEGISTLYIMVEYLETIILDLNLSSNCE